MVVLGVSSIVISHISWKENKTPGVEIPPPPPQEGKRRRTISASGGLGPLQMVSEPDTR